MNSEELVDKYPKILGEPGGYPGVNPGWLPLIDSLCEWLQSGTDHNHQPQVVAVQVKEKFGELRFYTEGASESQEAAISFAEHLSSQICEVCGAAGKLRAERGWLRTLCDEHSE